MNDTVNINEAKTHLSQFIECVRAAEKIPIAKSGKPGPRLVPLSTPAPCCPGLLVGAVENVLFEALPEQERDAGER